MARIVSLNIPDNVRLIEGASQYWSDKPKLSADIDWSDVLTGISVGRTLVIGWAPENTLQAIAQQSDELHVLVRGAVDAAETGTLLPSATVWCGAPQALAEHTEPFDSVLCLADVSRVLPLECEERTWQEMRDDILALAKPDAPTVMWVENDLGIHRLTQNHNPRAASSDADWNVLATFDATRPLTLSDVKAAFGNDVMVRLTWPSAQWSMLVDPEEADPVMHAAFAERAALAPVNGPDPAYILTTASRAGRLEEFASGWLVALHTPAASEAPIVVAAPGGVALLDGPLPASARTATSVFAELAAKEGMAAIRRFIAAWSTRYEQLDGAPSLHLNVAELVDDEFVFTPLAAAPRGASEQLRWRALGELVGTMRGRSWRHLWPGNYTDERILNHLGIMAGLHTVTPARAQALIPAAPDKYEGFTSLDMQSMAAAIDRNNETINSLRSQVALLKMDLEKARNHGPFRMPRTVLRFAKRNVRAILKPQE